MNDEGRLHAYREVARLLEAKGREVRHEARMAGMVAAVRIDTQADVWFAAAELVRGSNSDT